MALSTSRASISSERLALLEQGVVESKTLTEALAVNQTELFRTVFPDATSELLNEIAATETLGIAARMRTIGAALLTHLPESSVARLVDHTSDTARGWWCFWIASNPEIDTPEHILTRIQPSADDPHFAVREWAWLATRPKLSERLNESIQVLSTWTDSDSERIRRFASESLRPRGVWCKHIAELKKHPELGSPILEPLRSDTSKYVQDSVANWINDAAKSQPEWALELAARWSSESPTPQTQRIVRRGLRSM